MLSQGIRLTIKSLQCPKQLRFINYLPKCATHARNYSSEDKWHHRTPVRIVNEEEILQHHVKAAAGPYEFIDDSKPAEPQIKQPKPLTQKKVKRKETKKKYLRPMPNDTLRKENGDLNFTELKEADKILTMLMMSVRSKKERNSNCRIILEGHRLITDAIDAHAVPETIVFSRSVDVLKLPLPEKGVKLFKVPYRAIQTWSTLVTPPGIMGFFKLPDVENHRPPADALPLTIVCDMVRDPGNLGSILRAAAAVGCKKVITTKGCVDIWDPKVLKTAAGAHFRLPIFASKLWEDLPRLTNPMANFYVADHVGERAVEPEAELEPEAESEVVLNAENYNETDELEVENNYEDKNTTQTAPIRKTSFQRKREIKIANEIIANIPVIPYYATDYTSDETVIIIGGETEGLSLEALDLIDKQNGVRVNIPMSNGFDSLNSGMALGIIAFEIRKQFSVKQANKQQ